MDRNLLLAIVLSMGVLLGWEAFVIGPQRERLREAQEAQAIAAAETTSDESRSSEQGGLGSLAVPEQEITVDDALSRAPGRVPIKTETVAGSINLQGGRIDDLQLLQYRAELNDNSETIRLLSPRETEHGHYAQLGWSVSTSTGADASENDPWTAQANAVLTPASPVTLTREKHGLTFEKVISVDENYMFAVTQRVTNNSNEARSLAPYAIVDQRNIPEDYRNFLILHEGPVGVIGTKLRERKYSKLQKNKNAQIDGEGVGGWLGITNKNWLAAAAPPQDEAMSASLSNEGTSEQPIFRAFYALPARTVAPGETIELTSHVYGGPKDVDILQSYEALPDKGGLGIYDFDKAVDWGNFFFLTRPIFYTLNFFGDLTGNFGVAILILTLIIKALLFPLANKGYESMSKMKKLQPEIEKLRCALWR